MTKLRPLAVAVAVAVALAWPAVLPAQSGLYYQPHFPADEFRARWEKEVGP